MKKYFNPRYELIFHRVFGKHKNLCLSLINSMIPFESGHEAVDIEFSYEEQLPFVYELRYPIVNMKCRDLEGRKFIVLINLRWCESFRLNTSFDESKFFVHPLPETKQLEMPMPVYDLNFVNRLIVQNTKPEDKYFNHYKTVIITGTENRIAGLEFIYIELPRFKPHKAEANGRRELWLRFLTEIHEETEATPPELLACPETEEALNLVKQSAYTHEEYEAYLTNRSDAYFAGEMFREILEKNLKSDWEKAWEIGLKKGRRDDLKEGEAKAVTAMTRNALAAGLPVDTIMQLTGLTAEQIEGIKQLIS